MAQPHFVPTDGQLLNEPRWQTYLAPVELLLTRSDETLGRRLDFATAVGRTATVGMGPRDRPRALWLDCDAIGYTQFVVYPPTAAHAAQRLLVNFHPRRPLEAPPCSCPAWRRGDLCVHVLCVLLHVGDREVVRALRRLVPVAAEG